MSSPQSNKSSLSSQQLGATGKRRLLRNHESMIYWCQVALDLFLVLGCLALFTKLKTGGVDQGYQFLLVITFLLQVIIYRGRGVYRKSASLASGVGRLGSAWAILLCLLVLLGFVLKAGEQFSRQVFLTWSVVGFVLQAGSYIFVSVISERYREKFARIIPVMVIGDGPLSHHLESSLAKNRWMADKVIAHVALSGSCVRQRASDRPEHKGEVNKRAADVQSNSDGSNVTKVDDLNALRALIRNNRIRRVYLAVPISDSSQIELLHIGLMDMNVDLIWVPDIYALNLLNHSIREVSGMPLIYLNESPLTSTRSGAITKTLLDKFAATMALILFSPIMLAAAIGVKLSSPGPVFFKQDRHGWDGRVIKVWKFRSMKMHVEGEETVTQATREDPRITKVGRFLRRSSIDELPQLINVLQGTMSMVGPRPHAVAHNNYYSDKINAYLARHRIKPGITGLAQVNGFRGETETLDKMEKRVEYDLAYINNWSLWLDFKIMVKTPLSLLSKDIY